MSATYIPECFKIKFKTYDHALIVLDFLHDLGFSDVLKLKNYLVRKGSLDLSGISILYGYTAPIISFSYFEDLNDPEYILYSTEKKLKPKKVVKYLFD